MDIDLVLRHLGPGWTVRGIAIDDSGMVLERPDLDDACRLTLEPMSSAPSFRQIADEARATSTVIAESHEELLTVAATGDLCVTVWSRDFVEVDSPVRAVLTTSTSIWPDVADVPLRVAAAIEEAAR